MKIRNGFVSNSSSSSFLILGTDLPTLEQIAMFHQLKLKKDDPRARILWTQDYRGELCLPGRDPEGLLEDLDDEDEEPESAALGIVLMSEEDSVPFSWGDASDMYKFLEEKMGIPHQQVKLIFNTLEH